MTYWTGVFFLIIGIPLFSINILFRLGPINLSLGTICVDIVQTHACPSLDPCPHFIIIVSRSTPFWKVRYHVFHCNGGALYLLIKLIVVYVVDKRLIHLLIEYLDLLLLQHLVFDLRSELRLTRFKVFLDMLQLFPSDNMEIVSILGPLCVLLTWPIVVLVMPHHPDWSLARWDVVLLSTDFLTWCHHAFSLSQVWVLVVRNHIFCSFTILPPQLAFLQVFISMLQRSSLCLAHLAWIIDRGPISCRLRCLIDSRLHTWWRTYWIKNILKLIELSLLQIVQQYLFLLSITHGSELSQLVHLKDRKCLLVILLLLSHLFELLQVMNRLYLLLLVVVKYVNLLLVTLKPIPCHVVRELAWFLPLDIILSSVAAFELLF